MKKKNEDTSWEKSSSWYGKLVGDEGHYYHQKIILPNVARLIGDKGHILDLGCGNGILAKHLSPKTTYVGIDSSKSLLDLAKKDSKERQFLLGDVTKPLPLQKNDFDVACFILSLQNMERGDLAIEQAVNHLHPKGNLIIILNHPAFRIPRQSQWGFDDAKKIQYRQINQYMSPLKIPITMHPGKKNSSTTYSFHHPISTYVQWLAQNHCAVTSMEEWCSDKKSEGGRAKAEDCARKEFPLFLAITAIKV